MSDPNVSSFWFTTAQLLVSQSNKGKGAPPISIIEHRMAAGFSPPQHMHHHEDENFYVLEGQFRFETNGQVFHLGQGESIFLPRGIPHGFVVTSPEGGRCLTMTNGAFEAMVREASRPAGHDGLPEQVEPTLERQADLARVCQAHGIDLVGPPLAMAA